MDGPSIPGARQGFFAAVHERLVRGESVFVALVVDNTIHSPGSAGARLAVFESGDSIGTIGGGAMEQAVAEAGRRALAGSEFPPVLADLVHRPGVPGASGLICAGQQTNVSFVCRPTRDMAALAAAAASEAKQKRGELVVTPEGIAVRSGGPLKPQRLLQRSETSWEYREQLLNLRRVLILGGGHCGLALSENLKRLGYHVTVADERARVHTLEANNFADRKLVLEDISLAAGYESYPETTDVVAMGVDLDTDVRSLSGALQRPFPFIGLMGAPAKLTAIRKALADRGLDKSVMDRVTAPVGLPIGSRTPEEIAVSVAAQLIQRRSA